MSAPTFGRYELREELGSGAMGTVYRAYDPETMREVAIEVLSTGVSANPTSVDGFEVNAADGRLYRVTPYSPTVMAEYYDILRHRSDLPEPPETPAEMATFDPDAEPTLYKPPPVEPEPEKKKPLSHKLMLGFMSALAAVSVIVPIVSSFMSARHHRDPIPTAPTTTSKPALTIKPLSIRPVVSAFVTTPDQCPPPAPVPPNKPARICDVDKTAVYELLPEAMKIQPTNVDAFLNPLTGVQLVQLTMTTESSEEFGKFTATQVGKQLALVRDGTVVWGPRIAEPITGQVLQLSGDMTAEQAKQVAKRLREGS